MAGILHGLTDRAAPASSNVAASSSGWRRSGLHVAMAAVPAVRGWMESLGPVTAASLAATLAFPEDEIESALLKLESEGQVMRGRFSPHLSEGESNGVTGGPGAHSSADAGPAAPRNRAGDGRTI